MSSAERRRCAVVGGGVAGIVAAYLLSRKYEVDLYEAGAYLGGHTNTVTISSGPDEGLCVDTGFIVFNLKTYPNFVRFLRELGVSWQDSDMSFGYECSCTGWTYGGHDLNSLFAQRSNLWNWRFWKFVYQLLRLNTEGTQYAKSPSKAIGQGNEESLRQFLRRYSSDLIHHYVEPIGASIWSTPIHEFLDFPALSFFRFFENHGLLQIWNRPQWLTVTGGSHQYVKAFRQNFAGRIFLNQGLRQLRRCTQGYDLIFADRQEHYGYVVLATHADTSLALLAEPTSLQQRLLSPWRYLNNVATLHRDTSLLPANPRARSSWNYRRKSDRSLPTLTYDMNRLQRLKAQHHYLVSLNAQSEIAPSTVVGQWNYHHPQFDWSSMKTQSELGLLNTDGLAFCGSYHGYGFHEDAVASAVRAASSLGVQW